MSENPARVKLILFTGIAAASLSSILVRFSAAPPQAIAFYRMFFTTLMLTPWFLFKSRWFGRPGRYGRTSGIPLPSRSSFLLCVVSGAFLAAHFASWIASLSYTTVSSSVVLVSTHPIFVVILSRLLFSEKTSLNRSLYVVMTLAGTVILTFGDYSAGAHLIRGDLLALAGGAAMSGYVLIGRKVRRDVPLEIYVWIVYGTSAVFLFLLCIGMNVPLSGYGLKEFLNFAALAFFCTVIGHSSYNYALKYLPAASVSVSILIEPIAATLMAAALFAEVPGPFNLAGGALIIAGVYLYNRKR